MSECADGASFLVPESDKGKALGIDGSDPPVVTLANKGAAFRVVTGMDGDPEHTSLQYLFNSNYYLTFHNDKAYVESRSTSRDTENFNKDASFITVNEKFQDKSFAIEIVSKPGFYMAATGEAMQPKTKKDKKKCSYNRECSSGEIFVLLDKFSFYTSFYAFLCCREMSAILLMQPCKPNVNFGFQ